MNINLNKYKTIVAIGFFALGSYSIKSQDTTLIKVINLPYSIYSIANDSSGTIWLSGVRGLQYFDFEKESFITFDPSIKAHIISEQGSVIAFIGTKEQHSYPWDRFLPWSRKIPQNTIRASAAQDKFGNHWVSTGNQIFIFSIEDRFNQILKGYSTRGIHKEGKDLYVNTYRKIQKNDSILFERPASAMGEIKKFKESLYFAWGGIVRYNLVTQDSTYLKFESSRGGLNNPKPLIAKCLEQFKDTLWVGTNFGLGYIDDDSVIMVSNYPDIAHLKVTKDGFLIAGSSILKTQTSPLPSQNLPFPDCNECKGVYLKENNKLRKLDLPETNYRHILESDENYYFASDSGVIVWNGKKVINVITEENGLTSNQTCLTIKDKHGFLWVSTFSGLNRINLANENITHYLNNIEFNYLSLNHSDSLIYMGSVQGVYTFNPDNFIGDDILIPEPVSTQQIILIFSTLLLIILFGLSYFFNRYYARIALTKEVTLKGLERKLFFLQIDKIVFNTDVPLTVNHLSENLDMSERTLYRKFEEYDLTPGSYLKKLRVKKARYLLNKENNNMSFKEIAQKVGYSEAYLKKLLER